MSDTKHRKGNRRLKGKRRSKRGTSRAECWACGRKSKLCHAYCTLASQGWYRKPMAGYPSLDEVYCNRCLHNFGPPDKWLPSVLGETSAAQAN